MPNQTVAATTARQRTEAPASPSRLAIRWMLTGRWHLLALFASPLGRAMIRSKYDAFTTDAAYDPTPRGSNPVARMIDGIVRRRDTHVALRQRLRIVTEELVDVSLVERGDGPVRIVSAPVGLGRDLRQAWGRLETLGVEPSAWVEAIGIDLDERGTVLERAARLASAEHVPLETHRADLLSRDAIEVVPAGSADVVSSIGLSVWLDDEGLRRLLETARTMLRPGGTLLVDHWRPHGGSRYVGALEMPARYLTDARFETAVSGAGFGIESARSTENGVLAVYRARRLPD